MERRRADPIPRFLPASASPAGMSRDETGRGEMQSVTASQEVVRYRAMSSAVIVDPAASAAACTEESKSEAVSK